LEAVKKAAKVAKTCPNHKVCSGKKALTACYCGIKYQSMTK